MAKRDLPNVYITVNDQSAIVEGDESLTVGITLRANRGPMNEAYNIQDSSDFLTRYTFTGKPGTKQDTTYFDIIELLKVSDNIYVSRAANNPLYGGLLFKKEEKVGNLVGITAGNLKRILIAGDVSGKLKAGDVIRIDGDNLVEGNYGRFVVDKVTYVLPFTQVELTEELAEEITPTEQSEEAEVFGEVILCTAPVPLNQILIANKIAEVQQDKKAFIFDGNVRAKFTVGDRFRIDGFKKVVTDAEEDTALFTVAEAVYEQATVKTTVTVVEDIEGTVAADLIATPAEEGEPDAEPTPAVGVSVNVYMNDIAEPNTFEFGKDDLFLVTGIDQGEYNSKIGIEIVSGNEEDLDVDNAFKLYVHNLETATDLEEYVCSMSLTQKTIDGTNIHIKDVINPMSQYIKVWTPADEDIIEDTIPSSTGDYIALGGGYDGDEIGVENNIEALQVFADKTIPVSILVNGNNANVLYQSAIIAICEDRKDCFAFLRTPKSYEELKMPSQRVKSLISYKKDTLGSKSYLAAIYGPSITVTDNYNARKVTIGADSVACRRWLEVLKSDGYPYAAAGIIKGRLDNVTVNWKIGDESSEAKSINEASMNTAVYEARQKYYYFNTQNTLQLADSAFRNIGAVLNILGIKEALAVRLKEYVQYPITANSNNTVREAIMRTMQTYMDGCLSSERISNYAINDNTTALDISKNQLQYLLTLSPAYYAQKIYLVMNVVNAAFDFSILQSNN